MSVEELIQQLEYYRNTLNIRNINCGMLRRIGKTEALKRIIKQYYAMHPEITIYILVRNRSMIIEYNLEMLNIARILSIAELQHMQSFRGQMNVAFFADEIPNAEILFGENFVAGFYSTLDSPSIQNQNQLNATELKQQIPFHQRSAYRTVRKRKEKIRFKIKYKFIQKRS